MTKNQLSLISDLLDKYSIALSANACNDWDFPGNWTIEEKQSFVQAYHEWNGDHEEYSPDRLNLPDFGVAMYLAALVRESWECGEDD